MFGTKKNKSINAFIFMPMPVPAPAPMHMYILTLILIFNVNYWNLLLHFEIKCLYAEMRLHFPVIKFR